MSNRTDNQPEPSDRSEQQAAGGALWSSPEGRLLLAGVSIAFCYTAWLAVELVFDPEHSQMLIGMTATAVMFGRAAGMAFGYSMELPHTHVIPISMVVETVMVLIMYPLFVFSWRHLLVIKRLKTVFDHIRAAAERHKAKIQKYGILGLFAFVWFPFWMTGPVVGCVIGFLLGLRARVTITVVLSGTYVAILGWAFMLRHFHKKVAAYSPYAATLIMLVLVAVIIAGHLLHRGPGRRK